MQVRKAVIGSVMLGAISAAGLGMAGSASASPYQYQPKPKVTYSYTSNTTKVTVVKDNQQVGAGNTQQTATNSGNISNPQLALGVNVGAQVPLQVGVNAASGFSDATQVQKPRLTQYAGENYSNNSTSVNTSAENGNFSHVSIGN